MLAASFLKIESPTPYTFRNSSNLHYGINFAYGGTGIFSTSIDGPNATAQIDSFEKLIQQNIYTKHDLESSIALVNAGGNDYTNALKTGRIIVSGHSNNYVYIWHYVSCSYCLILLCDLNQIVE